jgi:hypothetical protein
MYALAATIFTLLMAFSTPNGKPSVETYIFDDGKVCQEMRQEIIDLAKDRSEFGDAQGLCVRTDLDENAFVHS